MPSGGVREGAGRPKGSVTAKRQITAAMVGRSDYLPVEYMLALMRDEECEPQRRDQMAIQAAPFCHPRLTAVSTTNPSGTAGNGDINLVQIFSVPRGAALDLKDGVVTIDGQATESQQLTPIEPFEGTPALRTKDAPVTVPDNPPPLSFPRPEPLPVIELDIANVTRLDAWRDKPDE